jgi:hypothetical protein
VKSITDTLHSPWGGPLINLNPHQKDPASHHVRHIEDLAIGQDANVLRHSAFRQFQAIANAR